MLEIPRMNLDDQHHDPKHPAWICPVDGEGKNLKPLIRCNCGQWCGLGLHHVHADGTVTASFWHSKGENAAVGQSPDGCGWHVWLKLKNYDAGDFPAIVP